MTVWWFLLTKKLPQHAIPTAPSLCPTAILQPGGTETLPFAGPTHTLGCLLTLSSLSSPMQGFNWTYHSHLESKWPRPPLSNPAWSASRGVVSQHPSNIQNHLGGVRNFTTLTQKPSGSGKWLKPGISLREIMSNPTGKKSLLSWSSLSPLPSSDLIDPGPLGLHC